MAPILTLSRLCKGLILAVIGGVCSMSLYAQSPSCDKAWAEYNEFRKRNSMEESQYPLTIQGAAVRAACGADALPAPPGSDVIMFRPHIVRPVVPFKPLNQPNSVGAPPASNQVKPASSSGVYPRAN